MGVNFSNHLLYHRGHTWVRPEKDGTLTVGLDEFARHLIGHPDSVQLPAKGSKIESNGIAWRMMKNGHEIRVRAPIDGTVVATGGDEDGWYLKLRPRHARQISVTCCAAQRYPDGCPQSSTACNCNSPRPTGRSAWRMAEPSCRIS